jgi:hypothetical protein
MCQKRDTLNHLISIDIFYTAAGIGKLMPIANTVIAAAAVNKTIGKVIGHAVDAS